MMLRANLTRIAGRLQPWNFAVAVIALTLGNGCSDSPPAVPSGGGAGPTAGTPGGPTPDADLAALRPQVTQFCGACHGVPSPDTFPRDAWYDEVEQGYGFYYTSGRTDLQPPRIQDVVEYYRSQAPAEWRLPPLDIASSSSPLAFHRQDISRPEGTGQAAVSHLRWREPSGGPPALLVCDMRLGIAGRVSLEAGPPRTEVLARVPHPAHIEPTDLDTDGRVDFVIADLGSFEPADHQRGQVVWCWQGEAGAPWETVALAEGLGRVADVQAADFDSDGDLDLIVAEFGWRTTGHIVLLEQLERSGVEPPRFTPHQLDGRHGTIHVPVIDLDGDRKLDFVALISQEHEVIEAFLGRGDGTFNKQRIHSAGDPSYGSSGIELVDMDGDGDQDVLYTNGDTLDSLYLKPFHAVQWLENKGTYPFTRHNLTRMPGAYCARAVDLDGDGDRDVVACAYFAHQERHSQSTSDTAGSPLYSLVWLEQAAPQRFVLHALQSIEDAGFMTLEVGDFNFDGRIDLAAGQFASPARDANGWVTVWWNDGPARAASAAGATAPP
jgi:hypothetical protein